MRPESWQAITGCEIRFAVELANGFDPDGEGTTLCAEDAIKARKATLDRVMWPVPKITGGYRGIMLSAQDCIECNWLPRITMGLPLTRKNVVATRLVHYWPMIDPRLP